MSFEWKAYCRDTRQLIDWECGVRNNDTICKAFSLVCAVSL